jgi:hypothetical protein
VGGPPAGARSWGLLWWDGHVISKPAARFLIVAGVFNAVIWPRFAKAIVEDGRAWDGEHWNSSPTTFFWVHAVLITTAIVIGLGVLLVGIRAHRSVPSPPKA